MVLNFRVRSESAQRDLSVGHLNSAQLFQIPNVDVVLVRKSPGFEQHHQISAAGKWLPGAAVSRQHIESFGQLRWRDEAVSRNVTSHFVAGSRRDSRGVSFFLLFLD